jgi:N-methylhydantoinase A/oxoprolinase/acetone carboxylase beta subunit
VGVGGDSFVRPAKDGTFTLGPSRVLPLCMARNLPAPEKWLGHDLNARCILPAPALTQDDIASDDILQHLAEHGPATPEQLMRDLKLAEITVEQRLVKLARKQKITETGFTPTDALHVLNLLHLGDAEAATAAATLLGAPRKQDAHAFAQSVLADAERIIEETVLRHVTRREVGGGLAAFLANRDRQSLITVDVSLNVPMIGIGAAARLLLPGVARRLRTTITFPERHEVGNALGAALMARPLLRDKGNNT